MRMPLSVADSYTNILSSHCGNISEYRNGSAFQSNLNEVLETLVQNVYYSSFNTYSAGDERSDSTVYGLVQCIGGLNPDDCQQCALTANTTLVQGCNGTSGDIQLNGCLLRYDDYKFYYNSGETSTVWSNCGDTKYRNGSVFERNLNNFLESLVGNVIPSGFNTSSVVEEVNSNSTVYGLVQCRGDLGSFACKQCASTAKANLFEACRYTSGSTQLDGCSLRYDNHNFYNDYNESSKSSKFCNPNKAIVPEKFSNTTEEVLSKIIKKTVQSPGLFATDKSETDDPDLREIYSLAQCWNLSQTNCRSCLAAGRSIISGPGRSMASGARCKTGGLGGCYMSTNCILRYELYSFFNTSSISSPPLPLPGESPPVSGIFFDM